MRQAMGRWHVLSLCLLLIALAGCGKTLATGSGGATASAGNSSTPTPSATLGGGSVKPIPTAPPLPTGTAQNTGCPLPLENVTWPPPPPQILSPEKSRFASLNVGQTLEIVLPFGIQWRLTQPPSGNSLMLDSPAGYGDPTQHACVWHFTAKAVGQASLTYSLSPLCQQGYRCSGAITLVDFTVEVH